MTKEEILQGNELIAEFMGVDVSHSDTVYKDSKSTLRQYIDNRSKSEGLLFHNNWDWLMEVIEKIKNDFGVYVEIYSDSGTNDCKMVKNTKSIIVLSNHQSTLKMAIYVATVKFIKKTL